MKVISDSEPVTSMRIEDIERYCSEYNRYVFAYKYNEEIVVSLIRPDCISFNGVFTSIVYYSFNPNGPWLRDIWKICKDMNTELYFFTNAKSFGEWILTN